MYMRRAYLTLSEVIVTLHLPRQHDDGFPLLSGRQLSSVDTPRPPTMTVTNERGDFRS